jgi:hypothetical protein
VRISVCSYGGMETLVVLLYLKRVGFYYSQINCTNAAMGLKPREKKRLCGYASFMKRLMLNYKEMKV